MFLCSAGFWLWNKEHAVYSGENRLQNLSCNKSKKYVLTAGVKVSSQTSEKSLFYGPPLQVAF